MGLQDKYRELIDAAGTQGISNLQVREQDGVLYIDGTASSEETKDRVWQVYQRLNPDFRSSDVVMNLQVAGDGSVSEVYVVKSGDSLSKIATRYPGLKWQDIYEANKDQIKNPDLIQPGWELKIPKK